MTPLLTLGIFDSSDLLDVNIDRRLPAWKHSSDQRHISGRHILQITQVSFALGALLGQDMTAKGLAVLKAGRRSFETLDRTTITLNLGHLRILRIYASYRSHLVITL